jgi:crossover junction endodeoxyribonuclease RuvC
LGIDPGSRITGFGIIDMEGNHAKHISNGCIKIDGSNIMLKSRQIFDGIARVIADYQPQEIAVEKVFMHKNADSALKLGQARGIAIAACAIKDLQLFEYTANQVKQATVGKGHAQKQQVQHMIKVLLCLQKAPQADAADALAVALCHAHTRHTLAQHP